MTLVVLTLAAPAFGHGVVVSATVEHGQIHGEASYRGGGPIARAEVKAVAPDGATLGSTTTDEQGRFTFPVRRRVAHRLIVDAGGGHGTEHTVAADELPDEIPDAHDHSHTSSHGAPTAGHARLESRIDDVASQLAALRKDLDEYKSHIRFQDLLGGVGYIVGLMGVVFYFLGVRRKENPPPPKD